MELEQRQFIKFLHVKGLKLTEIVAELSTSGRDADAPSGTKCLATETRETISGNSGGVWRMRRKNEGQNEKRKTEGWDMIRPIDEPLD
jgi:hypothetical protein